MASTTVELPLRTLHAALAIGLLDVVLSETLRYTTGLFTHHRRRLSLFRSGVALIPRSPRRPYLITLAQIVLLLLSVWMELSLNPSSHPGATANLTTKCYAYERMTQAAGRKVPDTDQLLDTRLQSYIDMTGCVRNGSLHDDALAGSLALETGFPSCTPPLRAVSDIDQTLVITGASIGFVGNWKDGDPFLAYGLSGARRDYGWGRSNGFAPTSFFAVSVAQLEPNQGLWSFDNLSERIITNVELPRNLLRGAPSNYSDTQRANITCPSPDDRACYNSFATTALALQQQTRSYDVSNGTGFAMNVRRVHDGDADGNVSSVCVFVGTRVLLDVDWVYVSHRIGDRLARAGPVATRIRVRIDKASCISSLPFRTGKAYIDATARIHPPEGLDEEGVRALIVKAVVVNGLNAVPRKEHKCVVRPRVESSTVGRFELIAAGTYFALLTVASVLAAVAAARCIAQCPVREDPLSVTSLLGTIRDLRVRKPRPATVYNAGTPEDSALSYSDDEKDRTRRQRDTSVSGRQRRPRGSSGRIGLSPGLTPGADYNYFYEDHAGRDGDGVGAGVHVGAKRTSDSSTGGSSTEHRTRGLVRGRGLVHGRGRGRGRMRWPESDDWGQGRVEGGDGDVDDDNDFDNDSSHFFVRYAKQGDDFVLHVS